MPLPFIIGGLAAAVTSKIANVFKTKYVIQNKKGHYYSGMCDKKFLFIKWFSPQWVSSEDDAAVFSSIDDANERIFHSKLRKVTVVEKS